MRTVWRILHRLDIITLYKTIDYKKCIQTEGDGHLLDENCSKSSKFTNGVKKVAGEWVPIIMFIGLTIIISLFFWFRYRGRGDMQQTIRAAIDKGQELSPEIIDRLGNPAPARHKDLRLALIWVALAAGLALSGFFAPDPSGQAFRGALAGAAFPFCIGVAYLIMWRITESDSSTENEQ
jgi:hypothetical protein